MNTEDKQTINQATSNSISPFKVPLGSLPAGRILAILFGSLMAVYGLFASIILTAAVAFGFGDSLAGALLQLLIAGIVPFTVGVLICWLVVRNRDQADLNRAPSTGKKILLILVGLVFLNLGLFIFGAVPILASIIRVTNGQQVNWVPLFFNLVLAATFIWAGQQKFRKGLTREEADHA